MTLPTFRVSFGCSEDETRTPTLHTCSDLYPCSVGAAVKELVPIDNVQVSS
jgi:hypothetical protein